MMRPRTESSLLILTLWWSCLLEGALGQESVSLLPWIKENYPLPGKEPARCQTTDPRVCDPDGILVEQDRIQVESALQKDYTMPSPCTSEDGSVAHDPVEVQYAVAFMEKMVLSQYGRSETARDRAAEDFARYLHDTWGVGVKTPCGSSTGVLIFLSNQDRTVFISRGSALDESLTDRRLDKVMANMKPHLQKGEFGAAVAKAIEDIQDYIESGKPKRAEQISDWFVAYGGLLWVAAIFGIIGIARRHEQLQRRNYARVHSHLLALDRQRAEALQGRFQAVSCPICLENFPRSTAENETRLGTDGLPLKLLRCGHTFDQTCWNEWINNGTGQVDKCPICGESVGAPAVPRGGATTLARRGNEVVQNADDVDYEPANAHGDLQRVARRAMDRYALERAFRLARLGARYPDFVRPTQIQRWSRENYDGQLVRDPSFVRSDPSQMNTAGNSGRHGGSASRSSARGFGGGSSSGGRAGRW